MNALNLKKGDIITNVYGERKVVQIVIDMMVYTYSGPVHKSKIVKAEPLVGKKS